MNRDKSSYGSELSLLDTVFIGALGFLILFVAALLLIRPPTEAEKAVKLRAEFVLTMTWPDGALDDIDMWLMLPGGEKVNFRQKDAGYVTLDRDDLGAISDFYTAPDGRRTFTPSNREMATIRAIVPGRYVVSAHVYIVRDKIHDDGQQWLPQPPLPYAATLEVMKLNPRVEPVFKSTVQLEKRGQEAVFAAFDVDADGNVTGFELNPAQYKIVDLVPLWSEEAFR